MSENPYQSPSGPGLFSNQPSRQATVEFLRSVAMNQKYVLVFILVNIGATVGQFWIPLELRMYFGIAALCVWVVGLFFVILLSAKVYGIGFGLIVGICAAIPFIGLLFLLMINTKATEILQKNGVSVGLLGARISDIH